MQPKRRQATRTQPTQACAGYKTPLKTTDSYRSLQTSKSKLRKTPRQQLSFFAACQGQGPAVDVQVSRRCEGEVRRDEPGGQGACVSQCKSEGAHEHKEWEERQKTRAEEVSAIVKAMDILKEEAVKEAFLQDTASQSRRCAYHRPAF